ncbi:MAG: molybdate ABC transporter substrate-binding protein [Burkholderiaceae bacterium]|nr:molybdate ABC transporter substrate-binding protein [Burkholderiaceae bacterium]
MKINSSYLAWSVALLSSAAWADTAAQTQPPVKVLAAGSLTGAMTAVAQLYTQQTGQKIDAQFGPAGLLRERIENGEQADIFASANMEHPQALADRGWATQPVVMLRNQLCAKALPESGLTTDNVLDRLLDPKVGLGTSTPKADPGGDYAWQVFARAEKLRPGAQAILEAKAQQLVGGKNNPPVPAGVNAMEYFFARKKVHISLGYCSSRQTTPDPKFTSVPLPAGLAVTPDYGLTVVTRDKKSHEAAYRFALFLMSPQAQKLIAQYGFTPVTTAGN